MAYSCLEYDTPSVVTIESFAHNFRVHLSWRSIMEHFEHRPITSLMMSTFPLQVGHQILETSAPRISFLSSSGRSEGGSSSTIPISPTSVILKPVFGGVRYVTPSNERTKRGLITRWAWCHEIVILKSTAILYRQTNYCAALVPTSLLLSTVRYNRQG